MDGGGSISRTRADPHKVHLDTCYARPILLDWDSDRDTHLVARSLLHSRKRSGPLTISLPVLGETLLTVMNDIARGELEPETASGLVRRLRHLVSTSQIVLCGLGNHNDSSPLGIAADLLSLDSEVSQSDALVTAVAISCVDCEILYTSDRLLLTSPEINKRARESGLSVRPAP